MKKFKAIGFDWSGVIFVVPGKSFNAGAAEFLNIPKEKFSAAYFHHNHMVNKGSRTTTYEEANEMWKHILDELGMGDRIESFMEFVWSRPAGKIDERIIGLIKRFKNEGWKIGLFSNMSLEGAAIARENDIESLFDATLFSAEVGYMKPEPEAFMALAEALKVGIGELIFIDDSKKSLSTADKLGYKPILYTDFDELVNELSKL